MTNSATMTENISATWVGGPLDQWITDDIDRERDLIRDDVIAYATLSAPLGSAVLSSGLELKAATPIATGEVRLVQNTSGWQLIWPENVSDQGNWRLNWRLNHPHNRPLWPTAGLAQWIADGRPALEN